MTQNPFTLRWGILATGGIAKTFTKDLLIEPKTRDAGDIHHIVAAAASSSSAARAAEFLKEVGASESAVAYGSYKELVQDPNVDIIYVATPHSHHYQHVSLALQADKHVLVEKPITVNAEQCHILRGLAKDRKRFLMEAVWTRFFPLSREVVEFVKNGQLGDVKRVFADFSFWHDIEMEFGNEHRIVNLDLAGGALLDLGIYSLTWLFMVLFHTQEKANQAAPSVTSAMTKYDATGADETTTVLLHFPGTGAHGVATTSIQVASTPHPDLPAPDAIRIQGTFGDLTVNYAPRPRSYTLTPASSSARGTLAKFEHATKTFDIPGGGHGMFWEADECARCIRDGKLESEVMPTEETEMLMEVMDQVRKQSNLVYPENIESVVYPMAGFGL